MRISDLSAGDLADRLSEQGLDLRIGPFSVRVRSKLPALIDHMKLLYADYEVVQPGGFVDFHVRIVTPGGLRRFYRPQALFLFDADQPFQPLPLAHAAPFFEWGLNWCIANHMLDWLIIHAAVLERNGRAVVMPGAPGSGKSTLAAALSCRGWRLLSDELAMLTLDEARLTPIPRPVSLKNKSIDILRKFEPAVVIGTEAKDTAKGVVAHMRAPADSVARSDETGEVRWLIFPQFRADAPGELRPLGRAEGGLAAARNAFNYSTLGALGFDTLCRMLDRCSCYEFTYGHLDEAIEIFDHLAAE